MEGRRIYVKHPSYSNELYHHGTPGMSWHKRLYQYEDGSLTPLGRVHYGIGKARAKAAEKREAKRAAKTAAAEARQKAKYQNKDGTLKLRGMIKYGTTDKYALLSDDELRKQTQRLQLQKSLEDVKKQTSASYRIKSKIGSALEDVTVAGLKKGAEKIVNSLVDKTVSEILGTDKEKAAKMREISQKYAGMQTNELNAWKNRMDAEKKAYELETGEKIPSNYKFSDLTDLEKAGLEKAKKKTENDLKPREEKKPKEVNKQPVSETKQEDDKQSVSENKQEEKPVSPSKSESSNISEQKTDKSLVNKKKPVMKEVEARPLARIHRVDMKEKMFGKAKTDSNRTERAYGINPAKISSLRSSGMTIEEIAKKLNISTSTVQKYM